MQEADSTGKLIDYYSLLFTFPSRMRMLISLWAISAITGIVCFVTALGIHGALRGLLYGLGVVAITSTLTDQFLAPLFRGNPLLSPRRINIVSYFWVLMLIPLALVSAILARFTGQPAILLKGLLFAASVNAGLRCLSIPVFSEEDVHVIAVASLLQPVVISLATSLFLGSGIRLLLAGFSGVLSVGGAASLALRCIDYWGRGIWEPGLIQLFRAFVYSWAEDHNRPLEEELTKVGERMDLEAESLLFRHEDGCRTAVVVPYVHPGPFRRLGSSVMPWRITEAYRERYGCEPLVTHGISRHETDLTNSHDLDRLIEALLDSESASQASTCTPIVEETISGATASCQVFGDIALFNLTLSPKSHDDLPPSLLCKVRENARSRGLWALVVDSHNCIDALDMQSEEDEENLFKATRRALDRAQGQDQRGFTVGAHRVIPTEWSLDDGMGPCGITSMVVELSSGERYSYILVDSNNMISGLRESILDGVKDLVDKAVICTSDTHMVNALGATKTGYSPFGEDLEEDRIIQYIRETVTSASTRLDSCCAEHHRCVVEGATVLGERGLDALARVIEDGFRLFENTASTLSLAGITLALVILYLA